MAYVAPADAEPGTMLAVEIREQPVAAEVVPLPVLQAPGLTGRQLGPSASPHHAARPRSRHQGGADPMVPADLRYTKDHEWVRVEGDEAVVGITEYAADQLGDIVFVELPGRRARRSTSSRRSASSSRSRR